MLTEIVQPAALCGLGAGLGFALTSVFIRNATRQLETPDFLLRALMTLAATMVVQAILQGSYVALREPEQLHKVAQNWRTSAQIGGLAALGPAGWLTGLATAPVALVRTVGQVEVIFTLLFRRFCLKEPLDRSEALGLVFVAGGVILTVIGS